MVTCITITLCTISFAILSSSSALFTSGYVTHEARNTLPNGFDFSETASLDQIIDLRIALVQGNTTGLEKILYDVSDPDSSSYGHHLSKEEVESYIRPSDESSAKVLAWLKSNDVNFTTLTPAGDWLSIPISTSKANSMFGANFSIFSHQPTGRKTVRALSYSIPTDLRGHIALVHPTVNFPDFTFTGPVVTSPFKSIVKAHKSDVSNCSADINPSCLETLYGIPTTHVNKSSLAVSGFVGQYPNRADLQTFLAEFRPDLPLNTTYNLETIDGGQDPQNASLAGIEANLDIQYAIGMSSGIPTTFISVGSNNQDGQLDGFLDIINYLISLPNPPQVLSTSYGQNEDELSLPLAQQLCNAYMQLGARGTSILFASGDGGVSGFQTNPNCTTFVPTFPSTCPYVTSVGASQFIPESAASFSSGGFSNYFAMPSYQSSAVSSYISAIADSNFSVASNLYNSSGRAYPDISAMGEDVEIVLGGETGLVAGTSCSTPIFAAVVALLNDRLASEGKPSMGFLNPFLYSATGSSALNDIITGNNPGCNTNGFEAIPGWDPVTGLGTPNFTKLLAAIGT